MKILIAGKSSSVESSTDKSEQINTKNKTEFNKTAAIWSSVAVAAALILIIIAVVAERRRRKLQRLHLTSLAPLDCPSNSHARRAKLNQFQDKMSKKSFDEITLDELNRIGYIDIMGSVSSITAGSLEQDSEDVLRDFSTQLTLSRELHTGVDESAFTAVEVVEELARGAARSQRKAKKPLCFDDDPII